MNVMIARLRVKLGVATQVILSSFYIPLYFVSTVLRIEHSSYLSQYAFSFGIYIYIYISYIIHIELVS